MLCFKKTASFFSWCLSVRSVWSSAFRSWTLIQQRLFLATGAVVLWRTPGRGNLMPETPSHNPKSWLQKDAVSQDLKILVLWNNNMEGEMPLPLKCQHFDTTWDSGAPSPSGSTSDFQIWPESWTSACGVSPAADESVQFKGEFSPVLLAIYLLSNTRDLSLLTGMEMLSMMAGAKRNVFVWCTVPCTGPNCVESWFPLLRDSWIASCDFAKVHYVSAISGYRTEENWTEVAIELSEILKFCEVQHTVAKLISLRLSWVSGLLVINVDLSAQPGSCLLHTMSDRGKPIHQSGKNIWNPTPLEKKLLTALLFPKLCRFCVMKQAPLVQWSNADESVGSTQTSGLCDAD